MKRWAETTEVMEQLALWSAMGRRAALATVVRVAGSAYRREGAKLLVRDDGLTRGNVSGGCLEQDVREVALRVIETSLPELRSYCSGAEDEAAWDLGVGCDGRVDVYVAPATGDDCRIRDLLSRADEPFAVVSLLDDGGKHWTATDPSDWTFVGAAGLLPLPGASEESPRSDEPFQNEPAGSGANRRLIVTARHHEGTLGDTGFDEEAAAAAREMLVDGSPGIVEVQRRPLFVDVLRPPPRLVIFGAGDDARPLATLAVSLGFRVIVVDRRPALLSPDRFPVDIRLVEAAADSPILPAVLDREPFVVAMTHSFAEDLNYLGAILPIPTSYVGVLGPRHRTERILETLSLTESVESGRIHGPIGLDIGGEGAEAVAVAIMAEIMAVRSGRTGEPLRDRFAPIHLGAGEL